ncbi:MAG: NAD(P)H-hydrate dehydratase [Elusimicrobiota bacterium]|nr:NAD(P)H-hydrate dehydratase [Endomicrobiia bacterium]MDW8165721.1 NAD(P)H-hydrate dehydratase [Elusimicrobiota bacterium]
MCNKHQLITKNIAKEFLPKRPDVAHKYDFGHILVIGGSKQYIGAPILAAEAALVVGSGLVSLAVPESIYNIVASKVRPEIILLSVPATLNGSISSKAVEVVLEYIEKRKVNTICLGCGLSREEDTGIFVNSLLKILLSSHTKLAGKINILVDADGFNLLEVEGKVINPLKNSKIRIVLTPHTGEYKNLFKIDDVEWQKKLYNFDFCDEVKEFAKINNIVLVLKSAITTISDGEVIFKTNTPNSALAKGGSGDVLAGIISGLIYQVEKYNKTLLNYSSVIKSAVLGVYIHQQTAELIRPQKTEFCFTPKDIIETIHLVLKELK